MFDRAAVSKLLDDHSSGRELVEKRTCDGDHSARPHVESASESFWEREQVTTCLRIMPIAAPAAETTVGADNFN
jgi:hypothetical protein